MHKDYSIDGLRRFLDSAAQRGFMARETANARKTASEKILGVLEANELQDLRNVDLDTAAQRFMNKEGSGYKPQSLRVYQSRLNSAVSEFLGWVENPSTYKPSRSKAILAKKLIAQKGQDTATQTTGASQMAPSQSPQPLGVSETLSIPVPLRSNLHVIISNIPSDMSPQEAEKIANVIRAFGALGPQKE